MFLNLNKINFSYNGTIKVLENISFSAQKGDIISILGASGSGKSTILRLIAGILPSEKGNSLEGSISINNLSPTDYIKQKKLAFMFQEPTLFPFLTLRKNIELPFRINNEEDMASVDTIIEMVGLSGYENYFPFELSGGMKTRTSLARSFITKPELLLLDEPFSSLDIAWKDALYFELNELRKENHTTIVMVTHDIGEALLLSDKVICLGINGNLLLESINDKSDILLRKLEGLIIKDHNLRKYEEKGNNSFTD
jgi:NitT/TauT family transport system ATP-binding protein